METKPAIYTTEFWIHLLLQGFFLLNTSHIWTYMPPRWSGVIQAVMAAAYMLARGQAKSKGSLDPNLVSNYKLFPKRADVINRR